MLVLASIMWIFFNCLLDKTNNWMKKPGASGNKKTNFYKFDNFTDKIHDWIRKELSDESVMKLMSFSPLSEKSPVKKISRMALLSVLFPRCVGTCGIADWFGEFNNDVFCRQWPRQSPDLNPPEHLQFWAISNLIRMKWYLIWSYL